VRVIAADDVARAALRLRGSPGEHLLTGLEVLTEQAMIDALISRFGGARRSSFFGDGLTQTERRRRDESAGLTDSWDEQTLGARTPFSQWVERLPGPRRRPSD
jgi:hypothetical protein